MDAKELRIGNYVYEKNRLVKLHDGFGIDHAHNFEPIPLAEEWLLKFGYEFMPWGFVKADSPLIRFPLTPNQKYWVELGNGFKIKLPYVHTLQNFISLTGTELNINE